jgi:hypothetical protein
MEIALYQKFNDPLAAVKALGLMFSRSGMFGCERPEQGEVLALICLSEGKSPVAITTNYDIVEGKLRKKALAALADFRSAGGKHRWLKSGDEPAAKDEDHYAELELTDKEGIKIVYRYSMADARAEGLVRDKSRWMKRPGNMLRARCISNGLGMLCPEIFAGEDDSPEESSEPKPLLRETAPVVTTEPTKQPEVKKPESSAPIDVPAEVVPQPQPEAKKFTESDISIDDNTGRLTVNSLAALEWAIGEANMPKAIAWFKNSNWITEGLSTLSEDRAKRIMAKTGNFLNTIGAV